MLIARMFGPLELEVDGRELGSRDLGGIKPRQLLEILLVERGHVVPKDRLAELLWGDAPPVNAAATLDTYASTLRRRLEPDHPRASRYVLGGGGGLLVPAAVTDLDLHRFDSLVGAAGAHARDGDHPTARAELDEALALIRGEVLEEEPYASWAVRVRDRYTERALEARLDAAEHALAAGDPAGGLARAQEVLDAEPLREAAHRVVMLAAYRLGRQEEALRAFERCRAVLAEELGVDPLPETVALHTAILRHEPGDELSLSGDTPLPQPQRVRRAAGEQNDELPFLGRMRALSALTAAAQRALEGAGGLIVVEGEAGIGKSRLVSELLGGLGAVTGLTAKCAEPDRDLPFVPLAAALRGLGTTALREAASMPGLSEILPELPPSDLPPETARVRALESVAALLRRTAPVALFLDDLQWADPSTVAALDYLQRRCSGDAVLLLTAWRSEEVDPDSAVARLAAAERVTLDPLTERDLAPLGPERAAGLFARSGGHPLWLVELLRAAEAEPDGTPRRLAELIVERCRRAGPRAHRLLAAASVLGRPFFPEIAAALVGEDPLDAAEHLEELCVRGLVRPIGNRFGFRHDLIADALATVVSPARRRLLHARALRALEETGAPPGELASHAVAAGLTESALRWSLAAAADARRAWANTEAAAHYERARKIADAHPDLLEAAAEELLLVNHGRVLVTVGSTAEGEEALRKARESAQHRGDARGVFAAIEGLAFARQRGASDPVGALDLGREALAVARRLGDPDLTARAHTLVGSPSGSLGLLEDEIAHCRRAVTIAEEAGITPAAYPMSRVALGLHHQGHETDALAWVDRAEDAAIEGHDEEALLVARWVRALACGALGRARDALASLDACAEVGRGEEVFWHARIPNTYGSVLSDFCLYDAALERDLESLEVTGEAQEGVLREAEFQTRLNLATDHLGLGDLDAAAAQLAPVRAGADAVIYARFRWLARLHCLDAEYAAALGRAEDAMAAAHSCLDLARKHGQAKYEVRGHLALARAHLASGERAAAGEAARAAAQRAERHGFGALVWRCWWTVHQAGMGTEALRNAQEAVSSLAGELDEPMRERFLAAVPVPP